MKKIFKNVLDNKQSLTVIARSQNCPFSSFKSDDLIIKSPGTPRMKPLVSDLGFGKQFTDNMLRIRWNQKNGWGTPLICPLDDFRIHPASKVLHYAQELFEGMKAYRGVDNEIRLFRPMHNMSRMVLSAKRTCFPDFEPDELLKCIRKLIQVEQEWVPHAVSSSLYIRPTTLLDTASEHITDTLDLVHTREWEAHGLLWVTLGWLHEVVKSILEGGDLAPLLLGDLHVLAIPPAHGGLLEEVVIHPEIGMMGTRFSTNCLGQPTFTSMSFISEEIS